MFQAGTIMNAMHEQA